MIGRTISHYRVVERLGGGAMGVVYRAEDTRLGRDVALKFLPPELTRDREARERFTLEARAASALDHANICTIHDIDETDDGQLFIAMAFYHGETLKARLARGPLPADEATRIARQVAAGLERAHEGGIVHRDVKPANLMITDRDEVKILDFGIAKLAGEAGLTRTGATLGTLAYMSPEQAEGKGVGPASDLWSLGVVLYEMATGTLPFGGTRQSEIVAAILAVDPEPPRARRPELSEPLEALVLDLLAKDSGARPGSAGAVVERLDAILRPRGEKAVPLLRRPAVWIAAAVAAAAVGLALVVPARERARIDAAHASLATIESLAEERRYAEAYDLALEAERVLDDDSALARLWPEISDVLTVRTRPEGADVYLFPFSGSPLEASGGPSEVSGGPLDEPRHLGATPIEGLRLPRDDYFLSIEKEGYAPLERAVSSARARAFAVPIEIVVDAPLPPADSLPDDMVFVPGGAYTLMSADAPVGASADLEGFFIDRFEVTNEAYLDFVRAGGYAEPDLWPRPIVDEDGSELAWETAMGRLRDRTGLPGPREWVGQSFEAGRARHPVTGVSWYEAAAYCAYRGRSLPTLFEWERAARPPEFALEGMILPWGLLQPGQTTERRANFGGTGTVEVSAHPFGVSPVGAYAMAGNAREWTLSEAEDGDRIAMGGSWRDPPYIFPSIATLPPLQSSPGLGFRCVERPVPAEAHGGGRLTLDRPAPTYEPVDEATYRSFLAHYRYDPIAPEPETIETVETEDWRRELIRFRGLEGDRILAYLYLPRAGSPPHQTLVFVAGVNLFFGERMDEQMEWLLGPVVRSGRAAFGVVLDGMAERRWPPGTTFPASNSVAFRDLMVKHATELRLGLDLLETREEIDMGRLAYVGLSWGAGSRSLLAALDDRFDAVIYVGGGIDERVHPTVPEALNVNFLPYIDVPKLVVNGAQDEEHPWRTRASPFYELLSEPKELVLADGEGHVPSLEVRVPAINGFLDRVFRPVR